MGIEQNTYINIQVKWVFIFIIIAKKLVCNSHMIFFAIYNV